MEETHPSNLFKQSPQQVQAWVQTLWRKPPATLPKHVNWWLYIAEGAASEAQYRTDLCVDDRLLWAEIALSVYLYAGRLANPNRERSLKGASLELSGMILCCNLIHQFSPRPAHPVLDPRMIEEWVFDGLPLTLEEASNLVDLAPQHRPLEQWQLLRTCTIRLMAGEYLLEHGYAQRKEELQAWLDLKQRLNEAR